MHLHSQCTSGGHLVAEVRGSFLAIKGSQLYFALSWSGSEPRVLVRHPASSSTLAGVSAESPVSHGCLVYETNTF